MLLIIALGFIAAACTDVKLPKETPSSPIESYQELPK